MPDPIRGVTSAPPTAVGQSGQPSASPPGRPGQTPAAGAVDSADVAHAANVLAVITAAAGAVPVVDETRVAALQHAVQTGSYQVNPDQVARKIAQIEGLLGR